MDRRMMLTGTALVAAAVASCSEPPFAHTNPLDSETPLELQVIGAPDTITSRNVTYTLQLVSNPPLPAGIRYGYYSNHSSIVFPFDNSMIRGLATLRPRTVEAGARIGDRRVPREFVLLQKVGELQAICAGQCIGIQAFGAPFGLTVSGIDLHGDILRDVTAGFPRATFTSRTPGLVVKQGPEEAALFAAATNGSGWLVMTLDGVSDSIFVTVSQRAVQWTPVCPGPIAVGETMMLATTDQIDANDHPLTIPDAGIEWFGAVTDDEGEALVEADGSVTGVTPGTWYARSRNPGATGAGVFDCLLEIVP